MDLRAAIRKHGKWKAAGKGGNCYGIAYHLAIHHKATLVHAAMDHPLLGYVGHAWVEYDGKYSVDLARAPFYFSRGIPYATHKIVKYRGAKRICKRMLQLETYGPWNRELLRIGDQQRKREEST